MFDCFWFNLTLLLKYVHLDWGTESGLYCTFRQKVDSINMSISFYLSYVDEDHFQVSFNAQSFVYIQQQRRLCMRVMNVGTLWLYWHQKGGSTLRTLFLSGLCLSTIYASSMGGQTFTNKVKKICRPYGGWS